MANQTLGLFLAGDLMSARGVDQILPHPGDPRLYEGFVKDARDYVLLAEEQNGPIPHPVDFDYPWGVAMDEFAQRQPDLRLVNLETAVTIRGRPEPKGINYRMPPTNLQLLTVAGIDACSLANNHVLDWGEDGLIDTLDALAAQAIACAGAGRDREAAEAPAALPLADGGRLLMFAVGLPDSGIPSYWAAGPSHPGVAFLPDLSRASLKAVAQRIHAASRPGDRVLVSIHWGGNWGFEIPPEQVAFAHGLIDAGVDVVHGHSSHHIKGLEIYRERLILYGCGDLLNDYEGIGGHRHYRSELGLLYFPTLDGEGRLLDLDLVPTRMRKLRLEYAEDEDARHWLLGTLNRECRGNACRFRTGAERAFHLVR